MSHNYIEATQERQGNGQFSTKRRRATNAELDKAARQREQVRQSETQNAWLAAHGLADVEADEIFANA